MDTYKWVVILFLLICMVAFVMTVFIFKNEKQIETIRYIEHAKDSVIGDLKYSTRSADFHGWYICDGRSLSRTTYHELFKVIGTTYGSNDIHTFNLPDARGRVIGLTGQSAGLTLRNDGEKVGEETHTMTIPEMVTHHHNGIINQAGEHRHTGTVDQNGDHNHTGTVDYSGQHSHSINDPGHSHTQTTINDDFNNSGGSGPSFAADSAGVRTWNNISATTTGITINSNGGHTHTFTSVTNGEHVHTFTSEPNGSHAHTMSISDTGLTRPFNVMQPTLFLGNLFIFVGVEFSNHILPTPTPTLSGKREMFHSEYETISSPMHLVPAGRQIAIGSAVIESI